MQIREVLGVADWPLAHQARFDTAVDADASDDDLQRLALEIEHEISEARQVESEEARQERLNREHPPPYRALRLNRATGRIVGIVRQRGSAHPPRVVGPQSRRRGA